MSIIESKFTKEDIHSFSDKIKENYYISPDNFAKFNVKRGLRNPDGTGVMAGVTKICSVEGYYIEDGEKTPKEGHLTYRGIEITDTPRTRLRSVPGYENGIDYKALSTAAYMYTDKAERIEIEVDANLMDHVVDWFGKDLFTVPMGDRVRVMLTTSPNAMEYWALQYLKYVEVISPKSLRDRIREAIEHGAEKYRDRP